VASTRWRASSARRMRRERQFRKLNRLSFLNYSCVHVSRVSSDREIARLQEQARRRLSRLPPD
jgi:hypothetical protein